MKRSTIAGSGILLLWAQTFAGAATIQFKGVPTGVNDGSFYVTPYQISIDGVAQMVTCYDVYDEVNFGDTWQAQILTLQQAALTGFFSTKPGALAGYERVAWLDEQTYSNPGQQVGVQHAIWDVFGTAGSTPETAAYEAAANAAAATGYQGFDFSGVRFIEQIGGAPGKDGTKQAFVYWASPPGHSIAATPEPASLLLAFSAMISLGLIALCGRTKIAWARARN